MTRILIVEDEVELARFLTRLFALKGFAVTHVQNGAQFDELEDLHAFNLAFIDVRLPDRSGIDLLQQLKLAAPACPCVIMTGYSTVKIAVDAMRFGAADFIEKPFEDISEIEALAERLLAPGAAAASAYEQLADELGIFLGQSDEMHDVYKIAYQVANKQISVLIEGETGSGKEMLTKFIHAASHRADGPLISVNCGALSETLLESELFGHRKGSFTGALTDRAGYFEAASPGTLFLDEIAEASHSTQVKLLRVLETGEFTKIGGTQSEKTEARIISASHENLEDAVAQKKFREDLLYRLDIVKLTLPPLRSRKEDVPELISRLLLKQGEQFSFTADAMDALKNYSWPGNMRELANTLKHISAISNPGAVISAADLPGKITRRAAVQPAERPALDFMDEWKLFTKQLKSAYSGGDVELEALLANMRMMERKLAKTLIEQTLKETIGNRKDAAEKLGITARKLRYYLNEV